MFVHAVYFSLRPDLSDAERAQFLAGVGALAGIETVRWAHVGVPAPTDRPVIDRDYTHALVLAFDDEAGQERYQRHPVHDRFREECGTFWDRVRIFDSLAGGAA
jgi:hypothetical protein